jgi:hypothetical protein
MIGNPIYAKTRKKLSSGTQFVNVALPTAGKNQTIFLALLKFRF